MGLTMFKKTALFLHDGFPNKYIRGCLVLQGTTFSCHFKDEDKRDGISKIKVRVNHSCCPTLPNQLHLIDVKCQWPNISENDKVFMILKMS